MKTLKSSFLFLLTFTLLTGVFYPLLVTGVAQALFPKQARGSLIEREGVVIGSALIGQKFESPRYFWPRPSAVDYNPQPSGGSNLGPTSADLKAKVQERRESIQAGIASNRPVPKDLLFASGSGLDPEISPASVLYQAPRVRQARSLSAEQAAQLDRLISELSQARQLGILGEPRVNVLRLNLAVDEIFKGK